MILYSKPFCSAKSLKTSQKFFCYANCKNSRRSYTVHDLRHTVLLLTDFVHCYAPVFLYMLRKKAELQWLKHTVEKSEQPIAVYSNHNPSGHCYVKVNIYFLAVGMIDIPTEKKTQTRMREICEIPQDFRFIV